MIVLTFGDKDNVKAARHDCDEEIEVCLLGIRMFLQCIRAIDGL
jgi:hypothetical protein